MTEALLFSQNKKMSCRGLILALPMMIKRQDEGLALRLYVTDCLQSITENTAKKIGGKYVKMRYADIIKPQKVETRTAEQIISEMQEKMNKMGGD